MQRWVDSLELYQIIRGGNRTLLLGRSSLRAATRKASGERSTHLPTRRVSDQRGRNGASIWKIVAQSRLKSAETLRHYFRSADLFEEHARSRFLYSNRGS